MGVVVRRYILIVYRFHHTTYPYSSFFQQHPYFLFIFLNVFLSCSSTFVLNEWVENIKRVYTV